MKLSPSDPGTARLNCTITVFAARIAACIASTLVPSEQNPCSSGGVAFTNTASSGISARVEESRDVRQERGNVLGPPLVDRGAGVGPDEQREVAEVRGHLGREMRAGAFAMEMDDADVPELRGAGDQRVEQDGRRGRRAVDVDLLAGLDSRDGLCGGDDLHVTSIRPDGGASAVPRSRRDGPKGAQMGRDQPVPRSMRCFATNAAACARRSRLSFERIELT